MRQSVPLLVSLALYAACAETDLDSDGVPSVLDCNDRDPAQGLPVELHVDNDGDGFGGSETAPGCPGNSWLVEDGSDCDDLDPSVNPGAVEIGCDGRDNDCLADTADGPAVTVGATWASVQEALDVAGYGEVVTLCASTIHESIVVDRQVTLRGAGAERTVLDGSSQSGSTVLVLGPATLQDLTISGGSGPIGGGIRVTGVSDRVVIDGVVVRDNTAEEGGGIATDGSAVAVYDSVIHDNRATLGGGVLADGPPSLDLVRTRVTGNVADRGGGMWLRGQATLQDAHIDGNQALRGGGVWMEDAASLLDGASSTISENRAGEGGGIHGGGTLRGLILSMNLADRGGGAFATVPLVLDDVDAFENLAGVDHGGGIHAEATVEVRGGALHDNEALGDGGGLHALAWVTLTDARIEANRATRGAGVYLGSGALLSATGAELRGNLATASGGGLETSCGSAGGQVLAGQISENQAPWGAAAVILDAPLAIRGTKVLANVADAGGAAVQLDGSCARATLISTDADWVGNEPADLQVGSEDPILAPSAGFTCVSDATLTGCAAR